MGNRRLFISLALVIFSFVISDLCAESIVINDISFVFNDKETENVSVAGLKDVSDTIIIPNAILVAGTKYKVTEIEDDAFSGNTVMNSILIPSSVERIGNGAFRNCTSLKNVIISTSIEKIPDNLFEGCSNLENVNIPKNVVHIGSSAFLNCKSLKNIDIPVTVKEIGVKAFSGCTSINRLDLPESVRIIADSAFSGCTSLSYFDIPASVKKLGKYAFYGCTAIKDIVIYGEVRDIEEYTFALCEELESINIPNSVIKIGAYAFSNCSKLRAIMIPNSVIDIDNDAFNGCRFEKVYSTNPEPPAFISRPFVDSITDNSILYLPKGSECEYKNSPSWNCFSKYVPLDNMNILGMEDTAFDKFTVYTDGNRIIIPDSEAGEELTVYDYNGIRIKTLTTDTSYTEFTLDRTGMFLVNYKGKTEKIILKYKL